MKLTRDDLKVEYRFDEPKGRRKNVIKDTSWMLRDCSSNGFHGHRKSMYVLVDRGNYSDLVIVQGHFDGTSDYVSL